MEAADNFVVRSSPGETWEFFWDLSRVGKCLPGCEEIVRLSDTSYRLRMAQRVGPFKVAMDVAMNVLEVDEGRRIAASGEGQDRMGNRLQIKRLAAELSEALDGGTQVAYAIEFNLYGKLASMGNAAVKRKVEETRTEFSQRIAEALGGRGAQATP